MWMLLPGVNVKAAPRVAGPCVAEVVAAGPPEPPLQLYKTETSITNPSKKPNRFTIPHLVFSKNLAAGSISRVGNYGK
jgi:hypothetical protein